MFEELPQIDANTFAWIAFLGAAGALIWAWISDSRRKTIIEQQDKLYDLKVEEMAQAEKRHEREITAEREARRKEQEECRADIHELKGRVASLESQWMQDLAAGVSQGLSTYLDKKLGERPGIETLRREQDGRDRFSPD
jgi:hypothetical protein